MDDLLKPLLRRFCDESEFCREMAVKLVLRFLNILQVGHGLEVSVRVRVGLCVCVCVCVCVVGGWGVG